MFAATRGGVALDPNIVFFLGSATGTTSIDLTGFGLQENDLVLVATGWGAYTSYGISTDPGVTTSGYTNDVLVSYTNTDTIKESRIRLAYKVMGATPDSSVSMTDVTYGGETFTNTIVYAWRRINPTSPLSATSTTDKNQHPIEPRPESITPSSPSIIIVAGIIKESGINAPRSGLTNFVSKTNTAGLGNSQIVMASKYVSSGTVTFNSFFGYYVSGNTWCTATLALKLT